LRSFERNREEHAAHRARCRTWGFAGGSDLVRGHMAATAPGDFARPATQMSLMNHSVSEVSVLSRQLDHIRDHIRSKSDTHSSHGHAGAADEFPDGLNQEQLEAASVDHEQLEMAKLDAEVDHLAQAFGMSLEDGSLRHGWRSSSRAALWSTSTADNLYERAEAMLNEQQALDEKEYMKKTMRCEGEGSATRRIITANIRCRLKDEGARREKTAADAVNQCTSIRNYVLNMQCARRELHDVRKRAHPVILPDRVTTAEERWLRQCAAQTNLHQHVHQTLAEFDH
jgi:hypothetical protein